jgi:predicted metal-binding membrane protein
MSAQPLVSVRGEGRLGSSSVRLWVVAIVSGAWLVMILGEAVGAGRVLHHDALIVGGPPLWIAIPTFLAGWLVMVAAMMLPASAPAIRAVTSRPLGGIGAVPMLARFLFGYAIVWVAFGLFAFLGDMVVHQIVNHSRWVIVRPWIVAGGVLAIAGAFEFSPVKRQWLMLCREPGRHLGGHDSGLRAGLSHGLACLGSSWALMLVMFAAGLANILWMVVLTSVMLYQAIGRHGSRAVAATGAGLLGLALLVPLHPAGLPSWLLL